MAGGDEGSRLGGFYGLVGEGRGLELGKDGARDGEGKVASGLPCRWLKRGVIEAGASLPSWECVADCDDVQVEGEGSWVWLFGSREDGEDCVYGRLRVTK